MLVIVRRLRVFGCALATLAPLTPLIVACGNQCERDASAPPILYKEGRTCDGVYTSSKGADCTSGANWDNYLDFPAGRTFRFEHQLGGKPQIILCYGAFGSNPVASSNDAKLAGGTALIIGNQCTYNRVTDTTFDVYNDTCSDVQLRVVASSPVLESADARTSKNDPGDAATDPDANR